MALIDLYNKTKSDYPNHVILINMENFYQTYNEDSITVSNCLGTVLTKDTDGNSITGFSRNMLDLNLTKLVKAGINVAILEPFINQL